MVNFRTLLKQESQYRRLLMATFLSGIGDWFNSVALLSLVLGLSHSGLSVGLVLLMRTAPALLMGPLAGYLSDRVNRKLLLVGSDIGRMVFALSFLLIHSKNDIWIAYVGSAILVAFTAMFTPSRTAIIPQLVQPQNIVAANSVEQSLSGVVMVIGSSLGGIVTTLWGVHFAFIFNSATFFLSALLCMSINYNSQMGINGQSSLSSKIRNESFIKTLIKSNLIKVITLQEILWPVGGGAINVLISVYGVEVFKEGNLGVGVLYSSLGLGFLFSGLAARKLSKWVRYTSVFPFIIEGLCIALASQSPNLALASIFTAISSLCSGIGNVSIMTIIMKSVPKEIHGRTFSFFGTISSVSLALSMVASGSLLSVISPRLLGLCAGILMVLTTVLSGAFLMKTRFDVETYYRDEISNEC